MVTEVAFPCCWWMNKWINVRTSCAYTENRVQCMFDIFPSEWNWQTEKTMWKANSGAAKWMSLFKYGTMHQKVYLSLPLQVGMTSVPKRVVAAAIKWKNKRDWGLVLASRTHNAFYIVHIESANRKSKNLWYSFVWSVASVRCGFASNFSAAGKIEVSWGTLHVNAFIRLSFTVYSAFGFIGAAHFDSATFFAFYRRC